MKAPKSEGDGETSDTIDHQTLLKLCNAGVKLEVLVQFHPGGWGLTVSFGQSHLVLTATRNKTARLFKKLETVVSYLQELGVTTFVVVAVGYSATAVVTSRRPDAAQRMKAALKAEPPTPSPPPSKAPANKAKRKATP